MLSTYLYYPEDKVVNYKFAEDIESIRFNLAGKDVLYEDTEFNYVLGDVEGKTKGVMEAAEWRRPKEICESPKFIDGKPHRYDALQGQLGDCWVVAAMEALTLHEILIKKVVPPDQSFDENYIGAFHFRIWNLGVWYDVVVDDRLPVYKESQKLCYCTSRSGDVFWAALLEKALAKFWVMDKISYPDSLDSGGFTTALINFSGGIVENVCANIDYRIKYCKLPYGMTLKGILYEAHKRNALMCCTCCSTLEESSRLGLVPGHGYTITDICKYADDDPEFSHEGEGLFLIRLLNPWGHHEIEVNWRDDERYGGWWKNMWRKIDATIRGTKEDTDDGEFWMNDVNFEKHFGVVSICHLGPEHYADCRKYELDKPTWTTWTTWKTTFFRGEWVPPFTAVGSGPENRYLLPQYRIELKSPESTIPDLRACYVVINLTHRSKDRRNDKCLPDQPCLKNDIGLYIYDTTDQDRDEETKYKRLGHEFFEKHEPLNDEPNWIMGDGRSYTLGMIMYCGTYCIVPCSHLADMDSQFLLRVFSTNDIPDWVYDKTISKNSTIAEENFNFNDNRVHSLFSDIAQGHNEIDWRGLKYIFETSFNSNQQYFKILTSIANYILYVFGIFSPTRSHNAIENGNCDFTKDQCRTMIAMLDHNHSGNLDFFEFSQLWNKINFWTKVYNQHKDETVGLLRVDRLKDALVAIGYDISTRTVHSLSYVYADKGKILLTDFVLCGVALETALSRLGEEASKSGNKLTLTLKGWVRSTLIL